MCQNEGKSPWQSARREATVGGGLCGLSPHAWSCAQLPGEQLAWLPPAWLEASVRRVRERSQMKETFDQSSVSLLLMYIYAYINIDWIRAPCKLFSVGKAGEIAAACLTEFFRLWTCLKVLTLSTWWITQPSKKSCDNELCLPSPTDE